MGVGQLNPRSSIITVAAADSTDKAKRYADYVCDGTADQTTIMLAIAELLQATSDIVYETIVTNVREEYSQGGKIVLLAGGFHLSGAIAVTDVSNLFLEGQGNATTLFNDAVDGSHAVSVICPTLPTYGLWHTRMRNFRVQGNELSGNGIHLFKTPHVTLESVTCVRNGGAGIYLESSGTIGADNHIVSDCRSTINFGHGMHFKTIHETLVNNCHIEENAGDGIYCDTVTDFQLCNSSIEDQFGIGGGAGLTMVDANAPRLTGNTFEDSLDIGLTGSGTALLTGNNLGDLTITGGTDSVIQMSNNRHQDLTTSGSIEYLGIADSHITGALSIGMSGAGTLSYSNNTQNDSNTGTFDMEYGYGRFSNSRVRFRNASTFNKFEFNGGRLEQYESITAKERLTIIGTDYVNEIACSIICAAADSLWTITGNTFHLPYILTLDGGAYASTAKLNVNGNTIRLCKITVDHFDRVAIGANLCQGYGDILVKNCDVIFGFVGNVMQNGADLEIDTTCACRALVAMNNVAVSTSDFTNNGSGETSCILNMSESATWGPNLGLGYAGFTEISNPAGDLKLAPDVEGDVTLFEDTDVADDADGKSPYVHRKAPEGDFSIRAYVTQWKTATVLANTNLAFQTTDGGYLYFISNDDILLNIGNDDELLIRDSGSTTLLSVDEATGDVAIPVGSLTSRVKPRIGTVASAATITPTGDSVDQYNVTALAINATMAAPSGTPTDGQPLKLRIKASGASPTLSWNAVYRAIEATLPTSVADGKTVYVGLIYNSADTKWDCVAVSTEA